jgi:hypothetical protein
MMKAPHIRIATRLTVDKDVLGFPGKKNRKKLKS